MEPAPEPVEQRQDGHLLEPVAADEQELVVEAALLLVLLTRLMPSVVWPASAPAVGLPLARGDESDGQDRGRAYPR